MLQQSLSPLVQVMHTPSLVISHLHIPMVRLQQQTIIPFIMQQQLTIVPARLMHRFCNVLQAILSSQTQVIFIPPVHFSILILQRGTITMPGGVVGMVVGIPDDIMPGIPIVVGLIIALIMLASP